MTSLALFLLAQTPPLDPNAAGFDPLALLPILAQGAQSGRWGLVSVVLLVGVMFLLRKVVLPRLPQNTLFVKALSSRWGGWALATVGSIAAAVAVAMLGGAPIGIDLVVSALVTALAGAGAHELGKDVAPPSPPLVVPAKTLNS